MSLVKRLFDNELRRVAQYPKRKWFKSGGASHYVCVDSVLDQNREVLEPGVVLIGFSRDSEFLISYTLTPCYGSNESGLGFDLDERNTCSVQVWKFSFHRPLYKVADLPIGPIESPFNNVETVEAGPLFIVHCYDQVTESCSHEMISVFPSPLVRHSYLHSFRGAFMNFDLHSTLRHCGHPSSSVLQCSDVPGMVVVNNGNTISAWLFKSTEDPKTGTVGLTRRITTFVDVQEAAFSLAEKHFAGAYSRTVTGFDSVFVCAQKGIFVFVHVLVSVCVKETVYDCQQHLCTTPKQDDELEALFYDEKESKHLNYEEEEVRERFTTFYSHIRTALFLDYAGLGTKVISTSVHNNVSPVLAIERLSEADRRSATEMHCEQRKSRPWSSPFYCTNATVASGMESLPVLEHPLLPVGLVGFQAPLE